MTIDIVRLLSAAVLTSGICLEAMSSAKETNLSALYAELNKFGQNGEYERALKTANKSKIGFMSYLFPLFVNSKL